LPFRGGFGSAPHAGTLDVDTDEVAVGVALRECDGVFALAAAQFEYDRTVVMEKVAVPMSFERMVAAEGLLEGGLYETFEREVLRKASEFVFAHLFLFAFLLVDADGFHAPDRHRRGESHPVNAAVGKNYVPTIGNRRFLREGCRVPAGRKAQRVGFLENQGVGRNGPYRQPQRVVPKGVVVTHDDV